jgi:hypothetical protein
MAPAPRSRGCPVRMASVACRTLVDWGELCVSGGLASEWADRLITITRLALSSDKSTRGYFHGTSACLSSLFAAGRYDELIELGQSDVLWSYKRWAVKALAVQGRSAEAIAYAERCRSPWASDHDIGSLCEHILLASGRPEEAYARYASSANRAATFLGWFRAVAMGKRTMSPCPRRCIAHGPHSGNRCRRSALAASGRRRSGLKMACDEVALGLESGVTAGGLDGRALAERVRAVVNRHQPRRALNTVSGEGSD